MPGVARGILKFKRKKIKFLEKKSLNFLSLCHPRATHECPQKIQPIRIYREHLYEYVLFYYTDVTIKSV